MAAEKIKSSLRYMSHLHTKIMHQKNESCHPCLAQRDKTISEVKLIVKFYSLEISYKVFPRVDARSDTKVDTSTLTNERMETCTPKSPMLTQV